MYTYCTPSPQQVFLFFCLQHHSHKLQYNLKKAIGGNSAVREEEEEEGGHQFPGTETQELTQQACREQETPGSDGVIYLNRGGNRRTTGGLTGAWTDIIPISYTAIVCAYTGDLSLQIRNETDFIFTDVRLILINFTNPKK